MIRFYLTPVELVTFNGRQIRVAKYFANSSTPLTTARYQARDYGNQPTMLVAADTTDPDDALLAAQTDLLKFSDNLDTNIGGRLGAMQTALEGMNLPAQLISGASTDRQVIRGIMACILLAQRMQGRGFDVFPSGVTLNTLIKDLPTIYRDALLLSLQEVGFGSLLPSATGSTQMRQLFRDIAGLASTSSMMGVTV